MLTTKYFIALYENTIHGIGHTPDESFDHAVANFPLPGGPDPEQLAEMGSELSYCRCTKELYDYVAERGVDVEIDDLDLDAYPMDLPPTRKRGAEIAQDIFDGMRNETQPWHGVDFSSWDNEKIKQEAERAMEFAAPYFDWHDEIYSEKRVTHLDDRIVDSLIVLIKAAR